MFRRATRGFTLLELMIAVTIMAVLAGSLYASLSMAFKARKSALASTENVRKMNIAMTLIRADLRAAVIPNGILAGTFAGTGPDMMASQETDLVFYASATDNPPEPGVGDIRQIEYIRSTAADTGESALIRRVTTNLLPADGVEAIVKEETICRGVRSFNLSYYDGSSWQPSWDSTQLGNILPQAVEVTLEIEDANDAAKTITASRIVTLSCAPTATTPGGTQ